MSTYQFDDVIVKIVDVICQLGNYILAQIELRKYEGVKYILELIFQVYLLYDRGRVTMTSFRSFSRSRQGLGHRRKKNEPGILRLEF